MNRKHLTIWTGIVLLGAVLSGCGEPTEQAPAPRTPQRATVQAKTTPAVKTTVATTETPVPSPTTQASPSAETQGARKLNANGDFTLDSESKPVKSWGIHDNTKNPLDHFKITRMTENGKSFTRLEALQDILGLNIMLDPGVPIPDNIPLTLVVRMRSDSRQANNVLFAQVYDFQNGTLEPFYKDSPASTDWTEVRVVCTPTGGVQGDYYVAGIRSLVKGEYLDLESWEMLNGSFPAP